MTRPPAGRAPTASRLRRVARAAGWVSALASAGVAVYLGSFWLDAGGQLAAVVATAAVVAAGGAYGLWRGRRDGVRPVVQAVRFAVFAVFVVMAGAAVAFVTLTWLLYVLVGGFVG